LGVLRPSPEARAIIAPCPLGAAFRHPGRFEENNNACFIVRATGQALAYFYFEDEPG